MNVRFEDPLTPRLPYRLGERITKRTTGP